MALKDLFDATGRFLDSVGDAVNASWAEEQARRKIKIEAGPVLDLISVTRSYASARWAEAAVNSKAEESARASLDELDQLKDAIDRLIRLTSRVEALAPKTAPPMTLGEVFTTSQAVRMRCEDGSFNTRDSASWAIVELVHDDGTYTVRATFSRRRFRLAGADIQGR